MTAATRSDTVGGKLYNKVWDERRDKRRHVCDKLDDININIIETTNTITHKHVDNPTTPGGRRGCG